jgi:uncharacterized protein
MSNEMTTRIAAIVRDAGGQVVGRTKLQKLTYFLVASGLEKDIPFLYKHYGPYSEPVAVAAREAHLLGLMREKEDQAAWGGTYSIFTAEGQPEQDVPVSRLQVAQIASGADAVELELAATALFLFKEGCPDAWQETERRKPEKATNGRLEKARALYLRLAAIETPERLPQLDQMH